MPPESQPLTATRDPDGLGPLPDMQSRRGIGPVRRHGGPEIRQEFSPFLLKRAPSRGELLSVQQVYAKLAQGRRFGAYAAMASWA